MVGYIVCEFKPSSPVEKSAALGERRGVIGVHLLDVCSHGCCDVAEMVESVSELVILLVGFHSEGVEEFSEPSCYVDVSCNYEVAPIVKEINQVLHANR